jgi:hypothetical protein
MRVSLAYGSGRLAADVRIVTGFIDPHFFAGLSGEPTRPSRPPSRLTWL